jgi:hypothetical protein
MKWLNTRATTAVTRDIRRVAGSVGLAVITACHARAPMTRGLDPVIEVTGATITAEQLRSLRWIEGTWRGAGDSTSVFNERYRFIDDSTLVVDDPTKPSESPTRFELRRGRFGTNGPARWVAVQLLGGAVTFAPVSGARNFFIWRPVSTSRWVAELAWLPPMDPERPGRMPVRYQMDRINP